MKRITRIGSWTALLSVLWALPAFADSGDADALQTCLRKWKDHPFQVDGKSIADYRTIGSSVKVLWIGEDPADERKTEKPELILVKPTVGVLSERRLSLMNPNGWYCLKANVTILAKSEITVACKASIESGSDNVTVAASGEKGVTVLGKTVIRRNCP